LKHRIFLDSNIIIKGLISQWTAAHALVALCAANVFKLMLAMEVQQEVTVNLLRLAQDIKRPKIDQKILHLYQMWVSACRPERIRLMKQAEIDAAEPLIAHAHDAPILAAAIHAQPDFLLTDNRRHFTDQAAQATGLAILSAEEFFTLIQK
jgi:predicted nucleic acid-binding protein